MPRSSPACSASRRQGRPDRRGPSRRAPRDRSPPPSVSGTRPSWYGATAAASESGGAIEAVTDEEILAAYRFLASEESVFCEAASAASVAGLIKSGVPAGSTVVCVLTGHGLKDPDLAISQISVPTTVEAEYSAVLNALGL